MVCQPGGRGDVLKREKPDALGVRRVVTTEGLCMTSFRNVLAAASLAAVLGVFAISPAHADTAWQAHHPRREQVNNRLTRQNRRIHQQVRQGELTRAQAARLHRADWRARMAERRMARRNGGYITRRQQDRLNRRETKISRRIGK